MMRAWDRLVTPLARWNEACREDAEQLGMRNNLDA
jgi:hypothetical protein